MSKTSNYQLTLWDWEDEGFYDALNENFAKLDGAARMVVGGYIGDGTKERVISLGFTPKVVLVIPSTGSLGSGNHYNGGMAVEGNPVTALNYESLAVVSGGFRVSYTYISHSNYSESVSANTKDSSYHYVALQ